MLIAEGEIKGNTFQGEIKYTPDTWDTWDKLSSPDAAEAEPRDNAAIRYSIAGWGRGGNICGRYTSMWGRYTKRRNPLSLK